MNQWIWILLKCVSFSTAVVLAINLASFLIGLVFYGLNETWEFHVKDGVFSLNDRIVGLRIFEPASIGLMTVMFVAALSKELKKSLS
jgi:hypothetical protein